MHGSVGCQTQLVQSLAGFEIVNVGHVQRIRALDFHRTHGQKPAIRSYVPLPACARRERVFYCISGNKSFGLEIEKSKPDVRGLLVARIARPEIKNHGAELPAGTQ